MVSDVLSSREQQVLEGLVRAYVDVGAPVGSNTILQREGLDCSPATIRKSLVSLEEKGYIRQPHTSAGRQPTNKGYRFFVEELGNAVGMAADEAAAMRHQIESKLREVGVDEIHGQLAEIIGDLTNQLGLVLSPRFEQATFHGVELVRLSEHRLLLVATISHGPVRSLVIEVGSSVSYTDLAAMGQLLNERLGGLSMSEVRATVRERVRSAMVGNPQLLRVVAEEIESLAGSGGDELHVAGARNICTQPEFRDATEVAGLLDLVERKADLATLLAQREGIVVTIGEENGVQEMQLCSLVTASYDSHGALGVIGVIGPTRMPYERVVALVNYAASRAADLVS
ncbi:heat-inducible transcriptional repressor HrcA [Candidatus Latescibacterota bacterium]